MTRSPVTELEPNSRTEWRRWLAQHHDSSSGIWLILGRKGSARDLLSLDDAVEEALCFGWIDSTLRRLDDERAALKFTPRRPGSTWAPSNKRRVASLIAQGLMTDAGLKVIEAAQTDGSWAALDAIEELRVPADLAQALAANSVAESHFKAFAPSAQKHFLWWIASAKRPETRARRIADTVQLAADNVTLANRRGA